MSKKHPSPEVGDGGGTQLEARGVHCAGRGGRCAWSCWCSSGCRRCARLAIPWAGAWGAGTSAGECSGHTPGHNFRTASFGLRTPRASQEGGSSFNTLRRSRQSSPERDYGPMTRVLSAAVYRIRRRGPAKYRECHCTRSAPRHEVEASALPVSSGHATLPHLGGGVHERSLARSSRE